MFGDWRTRLNTKPVDLVRCRPPRDDLVDVVGLLVAGFLEDVLAGRVLGFGQLGALGEAQVAAVHSLAKLVQCKVVVGDDRRVAVDIADVPSDDTCAGLLCFGGSARPVRAGPSSTTASPRLCRPATARCDAQYGILGSS